MSAMLVMVSAALFPDTVQAAPPITLTVIGDSLTAGYGLEKGNAFPEKLETELMRQGHSIRVINAGVSGDTSAGGRARLAWTLSENPDAVILELGANDALRGLGTDQLYDNLSAMLRELSKRQIAVMVAGMKSPPNLGEDYARDFEGTYARLAKEFDVVLYPFFLEGVAGVPELNLEDGIHPTAEGVDVIVQNIRPFVEQLLTKVRAN